MPNYLIPCECNAEIPVRSAQAGGVVTCPACGASVAIPKLRDLGHLRTDTAARSAPEKASATKSAAIVFLGVSALLLLGSVLVIPSTARISVEGYRPAFESMSESEIYSIWTDMLSKNRVQRPPSPDERVLQRRFKVARSASIGLLALAAVSGVAAAGAAIRHAVAAR